MVPPRCPSACAALALGSLLCALAPACAAPAPAEPEPRYVIDATADPSDELFASENLVRFDLDLPADSLLSLREKPDEYAPGTLRYRDRTLASIGVRLKGEASFRDIDDKPAFRLKLDEFVDGQRLFGLKRLTLNNDVQDPSSLSQSLVYRLFRGAGTPAPRCNHALVYVNGEYYGLYSNVETEDKAFLERWFSSNDGNLYEEGGSDLVTGAAAAFELETNEARNDRSDLEALIGALARATPDDFSETVGLELDLERYLSFAALEAMAGGEDGYSYVLGSPNNFRLYRDPGTQRFVFLPWGLDRALRPRFEPELIHDWVPALGRYRSVWNTHSLILSGCLASPDCQRAYVARLHETAELFEALELASSARAEIGLIAEAGRADLHKPSDDDYVDHARQLLLDFITERPAALRAELPPDDAPGTSELP
ncbi:MAG TPA: CotH kinase family protein [Polyangiaceae bacterium]|nr:CotH kinase family protein [Polyangiaceae bacterium]